MWRAKEVPAPALVIAAIASVQSGAALATKLFGAVGPGGAVFLRLLFAAVALLALARPSLRSAVRSEMVAALSFGVVLGVMNLAFYLALDRVPLGVAVTVEFLGPLGVAVAGSRRRVDVLWVVLAAVGVGLLAEVRGHIDVVGLLFAAVAGGCWAGYILLSQRVGRIFPGMGGLTIAMCVGAVITAPYGIAVGGTALLHGNVVGRAIAIALLSSALPYSLELMALRRLRASVFGILMSMEPAMAALSGFVFLGQRLRLAEWLAVGFVMAASVGATTISPSDADQRPALDARDEVHV